MRKVRIVWNGLGGELDSRVVETDDDSVVAAALALMVKDGFVSPGDSFTVEEVE